MRKAFSVQLQCPGSQKKTALEMIIKRGKNSVFFVSDILQSLSEVDIKTFFSFQDIVICLANTAISSGLSYLVVGEALNMEG